MYILISKTTMLKYLTYLLISEILFHPVSGGAEYVELYNNSNSPIALTNIRLAKSNSEGLTKLYKISDDYSIAPHDYVVITTDAAWITSNYNTPYPSKIIEIASMPIYPNEKGSVIIASNDSTIIDKLDYTEDMHSILLQNKIGVALERKSFDIETQNPNNWYSASSISGYGTPTYRNSQSSEKIYLESDFVLSDEIISPDNDGYQDELDITYQLQYNDLAATITIFDAYGRPVKRLINNELLGTHGHIKWNGTNNQGQICPRGNYFIIIEAYNHLGIKQITKKSVTLIKE